METLIYPLDQNTLQLNIEPLAAAIHQNVNITGIHTNNVTHEVSLYADDALLFLQNPNKSVEELIQIIKTYSQIIYKINYLFTMILIQPTTAFFHHSGHSNNIIWLEKQKKLPRSNFLGGFDPG